MFVVEVSNFIHNLYDWEMSQNFLVCGFKWVENTSQFSKGFIENYHANHYEGYFLEIDVYYNEKLHDFHNDLSFLPKS